MSELCEDSELQSLCKNHLKSIPETIILQFAKTLFPLQNKTSPYEMFYSNLKTHYIIRNNQKIQFDQITKQFIKKVKDFNHELYLVVQPFFKTQFIDKFRKRIVKSKDNKMQQKSSTQKLPLKDSTERILVKFSSDPIILDTKSVSSNDSFKGSTPTIVKPPITTKRPPLTLASNSTQINNNPITQSNIVTNLSDQDMCFCGKHVSLIQASKEMYFHCYHCNKKYHTDCMKRSPASQCCSFCHLRKLLPNKETKKTVFVGLLKKGRKKHQINFYLNEQDLSVQFKIQVRCFRIKQVCQTSVLFPDAGSCSIKGVIVKEFTPLHKQSSLKFRKDQPFYLSSGLNVKQNKMTIVQKQPTKENKDERIEIETHLFGIYVIQEKKVEWIVRQIKQKNFNTFTESKDLLLKPFKGTGSDQIVCQLIKISLCCSLSIEKLRLPARGIFCTHFQCFDLKNFLDLTVNSSNPRWLCPVCKLPAYQFKIDIILFHILQLCKNNEKAAQVIFLKNGQFKIFSSQLKECEISIKSIFDLPIEDKLKRGQNMKQIPDIVKKKQK